MLKKVFKGIGLNVLLLSIISFLNDISSEMILAVLPMFITALGGTGIAIGLISGLGDSVSSLLKVFSGYWSDKIRKRKPFAFWGYCLSTIAKFFFPLSQNWVNLAVLRPIERLGKGLRDAPRDALLSSSVDKENRGKAFGMHRAFDSAGAFLGSLIAFLLFWKLNIGFRSIIFLAALVSFLTLIPFIWVREAQNPDAEKPITEKLHVSLKNLPASFKQYLFAVMIFSFANFSYMFFVLRAKDVFKNTFSTHTTLAMPIIFYIWFNIVYTIFSMPGGIMSDKIGRKKVLFMGYLAYALTCFGFIFSSSIAAYIFFFALYGISYSLIEANQRAFSADFVESRMHGTALGTFHTIISVSALPGGLIAGLLWNYNPAFTFIFGAILSLIASVLMLKIDINVHQ